jgi:hypothetical protein
MQIIDNISTESILKNPGEWSDMTKKNITNDGGCIFRGLYSPEYIDQFKSWVFNSRITQGLSGNVRYTKNTPNHYKIVDKDLDDSRPTRFLLHQFFPWNIEQNAEYHEFLIDFMKIRNVLNGLETDISITNTKDFVSWNSVLQYRQGGDFLGTHKDRYKYQAILIMSELGKDFQQGGQYYLHPEKGHVYSERQLKKGDLVMLQSDIYHGVHPIDPLHNSSDDSISGRWIMFSPYHHPGVIQE